MPTALVIIAENVEELETIAPCDLLRRAGVETVLISIDGTTVTGRNSLTLVADHTLDTLPHLEGFDLIVLPGGPSVQRLCANLKVLNLVRHHAAAGKLIGAICAAPLILDHAGVLAGRRFTSHVSTAGELPTRDPRSRVVKDGNLITSMGAGTSIEFSLALIEALCGPEEARSVANSIAWTR